MKEPSLQGIVDDLTREGLEQLIELAEIKLRAIPGTEAQAKFHAQQGGF